MTNMGRNDSNPDRIALVKPRLTVPVEQASRQGRGFSYREIEESGASVDQVRSADLRIDPMRRSAHEVNVKSLQALLGTTGKERRVQGAKPRAKAGATRKTEGTPRKKAKKSKPGRKK
jgi:hypothetical protein